MHGVLLDTSAAGPTGSYHWAVMALGILTVIYVAFVRPMKKRQQRDPLARQQRPGDSQLAQQRAVEREMTALLVEYEQMMRTMTAQLETRVVKLEVLLADADARIAALQAGVAAAPQGQAHQLPAPPTPAELRLGQMRLGDATVITTDEVIEEAVAHFPAEPPAPSHAEVYELADEGMSFRQIAQRLDRPYGEIELILNIRPKGPTPVGGQPPAAGSADVPTSSVESALSGDHGAAADPSVAARAAVALASAAAGSRGNESQRGPHGSKHKKRHR